MSSARNPADRAARQLGARPSKIWNDWAKCRRVAGWALRHVLGGRPRFVVERRLERPVPAFGLLAADALARDDRERGPPRTRVEPPADHPHVLDGRAGDD